VSDDHYQDVANRGPSPYRPDSGGFNDWAFKILHHLGFKARLARRPGRGFAVFLQSLDAEEMKTTGLVMGMSARNLS